MDVLYQRLHMVDRSLRQDAVPQIENMARTPCGLLQDRFSARAYELVLCEQHTGIEISLNRAAMLQQAPAFVERDAPIQSNDLSACLLHIRKKSGGIGAEVDHRHARFSQLFNQPLGLRKNKLPVVLDAQTADPTIEYLQ